MTNENLTRDFPEASSDQFMLRELDLIQHLVRHS
jgi:hypothetical protein